jgi:uncharacterized protein
MAIRTDLDHLPEQKQHYVTAIRDLILNDFDQLTEFTTGKKRLNKIRHIILFGSYAKGTYVDDPANGYISDYDILVTLNRKDLIEEYELWRNIEDKAERRVKSPVSLIIHTMDEVGKWLDEGQYFFSDIQKEGIYLYCSNGKELSEPKNLTNAERKRIAEKHFEQCFFDAGEFFVDYQSCLNRGNFKKAAFELHQATERYYNTLLLVRSNYRPKTHNLKRLHPLAIQYAQEIDSIFPQDSRFHRRCFSLLKRAYVDARYSEHFKIAEEELIWLADQVNQLKQIVEQACTDHINNL